MLVDLLRRYIFKKPEIEVIASPKKEEEKPVMDKKIKKLQKDTKKVVKQEASLLKADKKNDKIVDKAKKKMKAC